MCLPLIALAPIISDKKVSEYLSPFNGVFTNMDLDQDFGVWTNCLKKKEYP